MNGLTHGTKLFSLVIYILLYYIYCKSRIVTFIILSFYVSGVCIILREVFLILKTINTKYFIVSPCTSSKDYISYYSFTQNLEMVP